MTSKLTNTLFESMIDCKYKAYLQIAGNRGEMSDFESMQAAARMEAKNSLVEKLQSRHAPDHLLQDVCLSTSVLKVEAKYILNATLETNVVRLHLDGLKQVPVPSKLGDFYYIPILVPPQHWKRREQKLLLAIFAHFLAEVQGTVPTTGIIFLGSEGRSTSLSLESSFPAALRLRQELAETVASSSAPLLLLNNHCEICEFHHRCHDQSVQEDNISLLRGMGEKEIKKCINKGLNTLTRLAQTFRPRRKGKRGEIVKRRYHSLQAMAVRDRMVYVLGTPEIRTAPTSVFVDVESIPEKDFVYLIGVIVAGPDSEETFSFWANHKNEELQIFEEFLAVLEGLQDFTVFAYGSYEKTYFTRMRNQVKGKRRVDRLLSALVNTLSLVFSHIYFPTYSNGLKAIARHLGCSWSDAKASGLQSIVWRKNWETSGLDAWKEKIITYNLEDCVALKAVTEYLKQIGGQAENQATVSEDGITKPFTCVRDLDALLQPKRWGNIDFIHSDFSFINKCAYFDYQRQRVHVRTNKTIRKSEAKRQKQHRKSSNYKLRPTQKMEIISASCPTCKSRRVQRGISPKEVHPPLKDRGIKRPRVKRAFDLVVTPSCIKRKVIECRTSIHQCQECGHVFVPSQHERLAKHFHRLQSWLMYQHIAHRISMEMLETMTWEFFGLQIHKCEIHMIKSLMARYYQSTYKNLLKKVLSGHVMHSDETYVTYRTGRGKTLQTVKGNVWVFASLEEVVYMFRPNREGEFLHKMLEGFEGVLVSDFYSVYDSPKCPQQKCLIHLMRDMNQEILNSPFDEELQSITQPFGALLRSVVEAIDKHGLKRCHLKKHDNVIDRYFGELDNKTFHSEAASRLRERLLRNRNKLFTFVQYDGVPWNNNCAENAIKQFAYYRQKTKALLTEEGLSDYLVLLSLYQTCRYKGISFFRFLLSKERDIELFCQGKSKKRSNRVEVYPKGFVAPNLLTYRKQA